jgi:hypothetical protein
MNVDEFRSTITPDVFEADRFIDWTQIEVELENFREACGALDRLLGGREFGVSDLQELLKAHPKAYQVCTALLAIPKVAIGFSDGRELSPIIPNSAEHSAQLLIDLGIRHVLSAQSKTADLMRLWFVQDDAKSRRYRVAGPLKERVKAVLEEAVQDAQLHDCPIHILPAAEWPEQIRGRIDFLLAIENRPYAAIASVFQTASGGRQRQQLEDEFPTMQKDLAEHRLNLIVIADGRGVRDARNSTLLALSNGVAECMNFIQAATGSLYEAICRLTTIEPPRPQRQGLRALIEEKLSNQESVGPMELPVDYDEAVLNLASYIAEHEELDLSMDHANSAIRWNRPSLVSDASAIHKIFTAESAIQTFCGLMGLIPSDIAEDQNGIHYCIAGIPSPTTALPEDFIIAASETIESLEIAKKTAAISLLKTPTSKISILVTARPIGPTLENEFRRAQALLSTNVVIIDSEWLNWAAKHREDPNQLFGRLFLAQCDLSKASPFVQSGVTPTRMFYGRELEEAKMVNTLASSSIALLGGRRIGKTSLMRHVESKLKEAEFSTYFADCQIVKNWENFSAHISRAWQIPTDDAFSPEGLFKVVDELKKKDNKRIVILLDEIDQLLSWDKSNIANQVPEAFFRACRTISQEGVAQFVFSGERNIATRLWDAHSPHWNFCQPLMLRQLEYLPSQELLLKPFSGLRIAISDAELFTRLAWQRTNGHPQILQFLGEKLIRLLNTKLPDQRTHLSSADVDEVTQNFNFAEHYLETYWGQSRNIERLLSLIIAQGCHTLEECIGELRRLGQKIPKEDQLRGHLKMLELYGILDTNEPGYKLRLDWFREGLCFYGPMDELLTRYIDNE